MLIQHKEAGTTSRGMFFVETDGKMLAELVYNIPSPEKMIIEHTEVKNELQGKNIGYQLVHAAVEYARRQHLKIIPLCTFAKAVFDKKVELRDVLV
jgi:uncharacterized protein